MSLKLRSILEGEGADPPVHLRRLARLKNEWPALFDEVLALSVDGDPVDLEAIANAILRAEAAAREREDNPITFATGSEAVIATEALRDYLDQSIAAWRKVAVNADHENFDLAPYYVDAYQSVRVSILGDILPVEDD